MQTIRIIAGTALLSPSLVLAGSDPGLSGGEIARVIVGLVATLGFIVLLAWMARKSGGFSGSLQGAIRILDNRSVGQRERIALVEVGGEQVLVGIAPGNVRTLKVLDNPVEVTNGVADKTPGNAFSRQLKKALGQSS